MILKEHFILLVPSTQKMLPMSSTFAWGTSRRLDWLYDVSIVVAYKYKTTANTAVSVGEQYDKIYTSFI